MSKAAPAIVTLVPADDWFSRARSMCRKNPPRLSQNAQEERGAGQLLDRNGQSRPIKKRVVQERHDQEDARVCVSGPKTIQLKLAEHVAAVDEAEE